MTLNLTAPAWESEISIDGLQEYITKPTNRTKGWNINTSKIKQEHNSDNSRYESLRRILSSQWVHNRLEARWISIEEDGNFKFHINISDNEVISIFIKKVWDFYQILKKYRHMFFPDIETNYYDENYSIFENYWVEDIWNPEDWLDERLLQKFVETYWDPDLENFIIEDEIESVQRYKAERAQAIEDTLSHSWYFISGKNKASFWETPFYDRIIWNPKLKKKAILLSDSLSSNVLFKFLTFEIWESNGLKYFCNFLESVPSKFIPNLESLLRSKNFILILSKLLQDDTNENQICLNNILQLLQDKSLSEKLPIFFNWLRTNGNSNVIKFLRHWSIKSITEYINSYWEELNNYLSWRDKNKEDIFFMNAVMNFDHSSLKTILTSYWNLDQVQIYNYAVEEANDQDNFFTQLWTLFLNVDISIIFKWLNSDYVNITFEQKLYYIETQSSHVIEKLRKWKNPILQRGLVFFDYLTL